MFQTFLLANSRTLSYFDTGTNETEIDATLHNSTQTLNERPDTKHSPLLFYENTHSVELRVNESITYSIEYHLSIIHITESQLMNSSKLVTWSLSKDMQWRIVMIHRFIYYMQGQTKRKDKNKSHIFVIWIWYSISNSKINGCDIVDPISTILFDLKYRQKALSDNVCRHTNTQTNNHTYRVRTEGELFIFNCFYWLSLFLWYIWK